MNIECGVSPGVVVTWSLQWSPLHPMFLAGKCSVTGPGLGGQSPGLGPLVTRVWPHPGASECQWSHPGARTPAVAADQGCARYEARARCHCLNTHLSCGQLPVSPSQERDTSCVTSHDIVTLITVIVLSLVAVSSVSLLLPGIPTNI